MGTKRVAAYLLMVLLTISVIGEAQVVGGGTRYLTKGDTVLLLATQYDLSLVSIGGAPAWVAESLSVHRTYMTLLMDSIGAHRTRFVRVEDSTTAHRNRLVAAEESLAVHRSAFYTGSMTENTVPYFTSGRWLAGSTLQQQGVNMAITSGDLQIQNAGLASPYGRIFTNGTGQLSFWDESGGTTYTLADLATSGPGGGGDTTFNWGIVGGALTQYDLHFDSTGTIKFYRTDSVLTARVDTQQIATRYWTNSTFLNINQPTSTDGYIPWVWDDLTIGIGPVGGDLTAVGNYSGAAYLSFTIQPAAVTFAKMQDISSGYWLGRTAAGTGDIEMLSTSALKTALSLNNVENTALSTWAGTTNITTLGTIATGTWNATTIGISKGGSGQTTANAALNAFLPSQTGNNGKLLMTDGANTSWQSVSGAGTVTSVGLSLPGEFTISGSPVTAAGTLTGTWANAGSGTFFSRALGSAGTPSFRTPTYADFPFLADSLALRIRYADSLAAWFVTRTTLNTLLSAKAPLASPTFTGTVTLPVGLTGTVRVASGVVSATASDTVGLALLLWRIRVDSLGAHRTDLLRKDAFDDSSNTYKTKIESGVGYALGYVSPAADSIYRVTIGSGLTFSGGTLAASASAPTFDQIGNGTSTSKTLTVGNGTTLGYSGTGIIDATRFLGVTTVDATEFGYLNGVTGAIQTALDAKVAKATVKTLFSQSLMDTVLTTDTTYLYGITVAGTIDTIEYSAGRTFTGTARIEMVDSLTQTAGATLIDTTTVNGVSKIKQSNTQLNSTTLSATKILRLVWSAAAVPLSRGKSFGITVKSHE